MHAGRAIARGKPAAVAASFSRGLLEVTGSSDALHKAAERLHSAGPRGLGVHRESGALALLLFLLAVPVFTQFLNPLVTLLSRRFEFQADEFACRQTGAEPLISALVKLYRENASTLTPDPLYSAFHDSHPPAPVRVAHLSSID